MKTRTALILIALLASATVSCVNHAGDRTQGHPHESDFSADFSRDFPGQSYTLYPTEDLTVDILTSRSGRDDYIVEIGTGTLLDAQGNGREDLPDPYNYISYRFIGFDAIPGDRIITYEVYDLHSDGEDDIVARYDYPMNAE